MLLLIEQRLLLRGEEIARTSAQKLVQGEGELINLRLELSPVGNLGDAIVVDFGDSITQPLHANLKQEALYVIDRVLVDYITVGVLVFDEFVDVAPPNVSMTF